MEDKDKEVLEAVLLRLDGTTEGELMFKYGWGQHLKKVREIVGVINK